NVLAAQGVFSDAKKGDRVPDEKLEHVFKTTDVLTIAASIIKHGELQLTTEQRRHFIEEKKKQIADMISRQGMDPKTKMPHPPNRILNAMEQARVRIDPFRPARDQLHAVLTEIQPVIPISLELIDIALKVPMELAGKASSEVRKIAPVKSEEWRSDSWFAVMQIPAGMQSEIYETLNRLTAGRAEVKILKEHKL
ncbi:MAG: ribosome assembly factor SBDS, partial [Candidatus Aenigmarchaeota archaeon]|nr:ribosome assembly factor SBDS [Candidatus Aenigmarchaeota archaeon]